MFSARGATVGALRLRSVTRMVEPSEAEALKCFQIQNSEYSCKIETVNVLTYLSRGLTDVNSEK